MMVKELIEILSKQNPNAEVTITKKIFEDDYPSPYDSEHYEYYTKTIESVEMSFSQEEINFCL